MSNSRILLGAIGEEDGYLTQDAQNTLFKTSFKTHTHFSSNWNVITNNNGGQASRFTPGSSHYFRLPFEGDLIMNTYLRFVIKDDNIGATDNLYYLALSLFDRIELMYKSKSLSSFDRNYLANYFKTNLTQEKFLNYRKMGSIYSTDTPVKDSFLNQDVYYIDLPLPFWFTKSEGQALPVWTLTDQDLGLNVKLANTFNYKKSDSNNIDLTNDIMDVQVLVNYGYLNNEEKEKFRNLSLEYVIDQVEVTESSTVSGSFRKKINLPKKHYLTHLYWNLTSDVTNNIGYDNNTNKNYIFDSLPGITSSSITFNGNSLIADANANFTTKITRYSYFGFVNNNNTHHNITESNETLDLNLHCYSLALKPNDIQVSGFVTTDKFNQVILDLNGDTGTGSPTRRLNVYQCHKNIIRFQNGDLNILFN